MKFLSQAVSHSPVSSFHSRRAAGGFAWSVVCYLVCGIAGGLGGRLQAQGTSPTGPQQLAFAGLRAVANQGQINAVQSGAQGQLYLLIDQGDGVRVLKTDAAAGSVLAQVEIGARGDIGLAMALDPAGNVYVTGTTTSGALTATSGAAFVTPTGSSTNSFVAKFDANLNTTFVTFAGSGFMAASSIAATGDAAFITGSIFSSTLPVASAGINPTPAYGSRENGFVEKFSSGGDSLLYATYLTGAYGNTSAAAIAVDALDDAYIVGTTFSSGYPTVAALVPTELGTSSGFLTKLTPAGDGLLFSTYIPGAGLTSIAVDGTAGNLLISGSISLGQFPVATVQSPMVATPYQVLLRMPFDGSAVLASTVLAPGTQSFVAAGTSGAAWVDGALSVPILPLTPLATVGNSFAVRVNGQNSVDQTARFGGLAESNPQFAGAPVNLTSIAADLGGQPILAGGFAPNMSEILLATETLDLSLTNAPTAALPSVVRDAVEPVSACGGSLCSGSAAYLAKLVAAASVGSAMPALSLSVDDSPNITLRNLGSAQATGLAIVVSGFSETSNCGGSLAAGGECSIALTGVGPGILTVSATNAASQTASLPVLSSGGKGLAVVFSPKELDFGIVSSASGAVPRTITVTNLTQQSETFLSAVDASGQTTFPYTLAETASDCTATGIPATKVLAPGGICHITLGVTASSASTDDGILQAYWMVGGRDVRLTGFLEASALNLSATEIDFGTQYPGGLRSARYLYVSNNSNTAIQHTTVTLPGGSAFSVIDGCPAVLMPLTICQLQLAYEDSVTPSYDEVTLSLDQGLTALVTGSSLEQPLANSQIVNPTLSVSDTSLSFAKSVAVTAVSDATQTLLISNTGAAPFPLSLVLTGDFTDTTSCGAALAGGASCLVVFSFAPSTPGARQGIFAVTAGAGTEAAYVTLSGVGTDLFSPASDGTLSFGSVMVGQPVVQWYKIADAFTAFSATVAANPLGVPYTAVLVEDIGYGHGQPAGSLFSTKASGTCFNCWLGIRFTPVATGGETGALTLRSASAGNPYVLALSGVGLPVSGLLFTPAAQDFGSVAVNSTSGSILFELTNLLPGQTSVTLGAPTISGDFALVNTPTGGASCSGTLAYTASCFLEIAFAPSATGPRTGSIAVQGDSTTAAASLTGYGVPDPGLSLSPTALVFSNVPGTGSTQQTVIVSNTSGSPVQVGAPIISTTTSAGSSFSASSTCGPLSPGESCNITVTFIPGTAFVSGMLQLPVTSTLGGGSVLSTYTVGLTGAYSTEDAGLEIIPGQAEYGPQPTGSVGITRQFTVENLTVNPLALTIALPRQFVLSGPPCVGLAPYASCNFSVAFLPLTNGDLTGTLFAQATPINGTATLNAIGYLEGEGIGSASLTVTGGLLGDVLSFGQVRSGQSVQRVLTVTNSSASVPVTVRRITSEWPFLSTSTCGGTLAPAQTCTITLLYTPLNQVAAGSSPPPSETDVGSLILESDAASGPDLIDLTGSSTPASVVTPSNTAPLVAFTVSQGSLTFYATADGSVSAPQNVVLANTGTVSLHILSLQTTADFGVLSNCSTLLPGASCMLTITFTPQFGAGSGVRVSALEIASDASSSLEFVSLVGESIPSSLALSQTSVDFGNVQVGGSATATVQITNNAASPATFTNITATGDYTVSGSCPSYGLALSGGGTCTLQITFTPSQQGTRTGSLSLGSSATTTPLLVALTGFGTQSRLQISPGSLSFGALPLGASTSLSLTLANTGTAPITGVALVTSGDYAVSGPCAGTTLAAGASCSVTITFAPTLSGTRSGVLTVTSSDVNSPSLVLLTGSGTVMASFTLTTAGGGASASLTLKSGSPAVFPLTLVPLNNFAGTVVLKCISVLPANNATCSLPPAGVSLSTVPQQVAATITTVSTIASAGPQEPSRRLEEIVACLLFPAMIFTWRWRPSRQRMRRELGLFTWILASTFALLSLNGCGEIIIPIGNLRYALPGTYQYQVTASSVIGSTPVSQTVTLNLIVQ